MQLDDMKKLQEREQRARDELHTSYQQRLRENQAEIEAFKRFNFFFFKFNYKR